MLWLSRLPIGSRQRNWGTTVNNKLRFIPRLAALALATAAVFPSGAFAQAQGSVDVDITLNNGITILYYYSSVDVNISLTDLFGTPAGCTAVSDTRACALAPPAAAVNANVLGSELVANFSINPAALSINPGAVPLVLQNLWAVRAVGGSAATTTVAITAGTSTTLNGPASSSIGMSNFRVQTPAFGAAPAAGPGASVQFPDPGLVNARPGDVRMDLNLTAATSLGDYSTTGNLASNADSNFTLSVTSN